MSHLKAKKVIQSFYPTASKSSSEFVPFGGTGIKESGYTGSNGQSVYYESIMKADGTLLTGMQTTLQGDYIKFTYNSSGGHYAYALKPGKYYAAFGNAHYTLNECTASDTYPKQLSSHYNYAYNIGVVVL